LKQWKEECPKGPLDLVFPNGNGNVESLTNVWNRFWIPLQIDCGMVLDTGNKDDQGNLIIHPRYGFHALRHAAASLFIQYLKWWSPKRLQTVMGHSSVRMTFDLYGHLFDDIEKDRADMATIESAIRAAEMSMQQGCDMKANTVVGTTELRGFVNRWSGVQIPHPAPEFRQPSAAKI
jgi:integrase